MAAEEENTFQYGDKYCFLAVWYNEVAEIEKPFLLSFFPADGSIELYDLKCSRLFLRRTKVNGISLKSLCKGSTVTIFSRQMKIEGYANNWTENVYTKALQKTFTIVKPHAINRIGDIIEYMEKNNFRLTNIKMGLLIPDGVTELLKKDTTEGPVEREIVKVFTEGSSIAIEAIAEGGLSKWAKVVGPENPEIAKEEAPDSLRAILGVDMNRNAIHISYTLQEQSQGANIWFEPQSPFVNNCAKFDDSTCCIIKPHAVQENLVGNILNYIINNSFTVTAMEMFHLERSVAEEFYEVYKGVVPEYSSMVEQLSSGSCIVLEVSHISQPSSSVKLFRELAGNCDPVVARSIHPESIRAKFGTSTVFNAIHCTDLPDDAKLEVEFFFKLLQYV